MRFIFFVFSMLFYTNISFAQLQGGISGTYFTQSLSNWETTIFGLRSNEQLLKSGFGQAVDLKIAGFDNYRIQFHLNAGTNNATTSLENRQFKLRKNDVSLSGKIFFLSLEADCDCPTFSREAGFLEKGLFAEFITGASFFQAEMEEENTIISEDNGTVFKVGFGLGVEIGINDYVTISPFVRYQRYFNAEWEGLQEDLFIVDPTTIVDATNATPINQVSAGIRLGLSLQR
ncbi:MAG: hypothetical protein AB8G86_20145 [Saprospiraceae bacterium]